MRVIRFVRIKDMHTLHHDGAYEIEGYAIYVDGKLKGYSRIHCGLTRAWLVGKNPMMKGSNGADLIHFHDNPRNLEHYYRTDEERAEQLSIVAKKFEALP